MSVHVTSYVWKLRGLTKPAKLIMLALADMANHDGECWPGRSTLAELCECDESTVRKTLRWLEAAGHIETFQRPQVGAPNLTNVYRIKRVETGGRDASLGRQNGRGEGGVTPPEPTKSGEPSIDASRRDADASPPTRPKRKIRQATPEQAARIAELVGWFCDQHGQRPPDPIVARIGKEVKALVLSSCTDDTIRAGLAEVAKQFKTPSALAMLVNQAMNGGGRTMATPVADWSGVDEATWRAFLAAGGNPTDPRCKQTFDFWRSVGRLPTLPETRSPDEWDGAITQARHQAHQVASGEDIWR